MTPVVIRNFVSVLDRLKSFSEQASSTHFESERHVIWVLCTSLSASHLAPVTGHELPARSFTVSRIGRLPQGHAEAQDTQ